MGQCLVCDSHSEMSTGRGPIGSVHNVVHIDSLLQQARRQSSHRAHRHCQCQQQACNTAQIIQPKCSWLSGTERNVSLVRAEQQLEPKQVPLQGSLFGLQHLRSTLPSTGAWNRRFPKAPSRSVQCCVATFCGSSPPIRNQSGV